MKKKYDAETCVLAADLRDRGIDVPPDVPEHAWIPKSAVHFEIVEPGEGRGVSFGINIRFSEPFRWSTIKLGDR